MAKGYGSRGKSINIKGVGSVPVVGGAVRGRAKKTGYGKGIKPQKAKKK
jgi:hypothetical protein